MPTRIWPDVPRPGRDVEEAPKPLVEKVARLQGQMNGMIAATHELQLTMARLQKVVAGAGILILVAGVAIGIAWALR